MYTNRRSRRVTKGYWPVSLGLENKLNFNVEYENSNTRERVLGRFDLGCGVCGGDEYALD